MSDRNGQEIIEWYSMAQGAFHDAMAHITGVKSLAWIGLSKTTGLNVAAKWLDDLELSNEDIRSIVGTSVGGVLGGIGTTAALTATGLASGPAAPFVIAAGGFFGGFGGDVFGRRSDELFSFGKTGILNLFDADHTKNMVPIGRVSSARLPGQSGLIEAGHELHALDVIAEQNSWQPRAAGGLASSSPLSDALGGMPFMNPSTPLGFGNVRGSTAAPSLGEPLSFPGGSPGYPASTAQRMKTLQ